MTGVSGTSVTVKEPGGTQVTIDVPASATITKTSAGSKSDLVSGACVRVVGAPSSGGAVKAQSVEVLPSGSADCSGAKGSS